MAENLAEKLAAAMKELAEAEAALPAHTIRPHQMQRVMELEERITELEQKIKATG